MKRDAGITADQLRAVVSYDPETGVFVWLRSAGSRAVAGSVAGYISGQYRELKIDGRRYYAHRLVWLYVHGRWPVHEVDHINGNKLDNRTANLRDVTRKANAHNLKRAVSRSRTGVLGIWHDPRDGSFYARIHRDGKTRSLGGYSTQSEAGAAYKRAAMEYERGV